MKTTRHGHPVPIRSVTVLVVTHNAKRWLPLCLGSLQQSIHPVRVVVVDNASDDGTAEAIRTGYPEAQLIVSERNLGFGSANNLGFRSMAGERPDAVYLLNQDAGVDPGTIGSLVQTLNEHPEYGVVSPVHYTSDWSAVDTLFQHCLQRGRDVSPDLSDVPFVNAAHWMIRGECLAELAGFAPIFHHYGEDGNFLQRLRKAGWRVGVDRRARAIHARESRIPSRERNLLNHYGVYLSRACNPLHPFWIAFPRAWIYLVRRLVFLDAWPKPCFVQTMRRAMRDVPAILETRRTLRGGDALPPAVSILDELRRDSKPSLPPEPRARP